jgi:threonine aldolase
MQAAMASAPVGDEQLGEDPTVTALCEHVASLLGMEAAVFLPSGTMCNLIAFLVHCRAGDEIITAANAHVYNSEGAGAAALAGAQFRLIETPDGIFDPAQLEEALRRPRQRSPRSRVVSVEQTSNRGGGAVWPVATLQDIAATANRHGLAAHMDGARLLNAVVASGQPAAEHVKGYDSAWIDLSKGLGCPVGAVLAGSEAFIEDAWVWKHRLGGAMRQAGVIAAAGLHALNHNVSRLAEDHENARLLQSRLVGLPGIALPSEPVETNIVFIDITHNGLTARALNERLQAHGIRLGVEGERRLRAVTHLDVSRAKIMHAADIFASLVS